MKPRDHIDRYEEGERGARIGIWTNLLLFILKIFAGVFGRSQAMIADAVHTAGDSMTSVGVLIGFKIARKPPDTHHPFGHGRAESISAKIISLILILLGLKVGYDSLKILISGDIPTPKTVALVVACFSIVIKEITYRQVVSLSRKIKSTSLMADAFHHRSDEFSSIAVLTGIAGARLGWAFMDPVAGIVVSAIILKIGIGSFHAAYDELMDAAPPEELKKEIEKTAGNCEGVVDVKKIMVRKSGIEFFTEITVGIDGGKTVREGHIITMKLRRDIFKNIPNVRETIVHVEPV
ncbi:MAG: cation transporter [Candidatus Omnitrophica bacterium]|nr:cation transporter [Candidatus Omnitrophota bacterium]